MRSESEVRERLDGCRIERDGHLHPQSGMNAYQAARLEGWMAVLSWTLEAGEINSRESEIREQLDLEDTDS